MNSTNRSLFCLGFLLVLPFSVTGRLAAEQSGVFSYRVVSGSVEITGCSPNVTGHLSIPAEIGGRKVTRIGTGAFQHRGGLTSVDLPLTIRNIGSNAFANCSGLGSATIPHGATSIGAWAFSQCTALTSVTIPRTVSSIGSGAFRVCSSLRSIVVDAANPNYISVNGALCNKSRSVLLQVPAGLSGSWSVSSSVNAIDSHAFAGCARLTAVGIPSSVVSIGASAFYGCSGLASITIPSSVTSIGHSAFFKCAGLTSVHIPADLNSIGSAVFSHCPALQTITVDSANRYFCSLGGVLFNKARTSLVQFPGGRTGAYSIPTSVTSIGQSAFSGCPGLVGVTIPSGVTSIGSYGFMDCPGLSRITIPASVTSIGSLAFRDCTGLTALTIQQGVEQIEGHAFYGCTALRRVAIPEGVNRIDHYAFSDCVHLSEVVFMGDAPQLGEKAFRNTRADFTVYYARDRAGFSTPRWQDYPAHPAGVASLTMDPGRDANYLQVHPSLPGYGAMPNTMPLEGDLSVWVDADPATGRISALTVLSSTIAGPGLHLTGYNPAVGGHMVLSGGPIGGEISTPALGGAVDPLTGRIDGGQYLFGLNRGTLSGGRDLGTSRPIPLGGDFGASPLSGTVHGGTVTLSLVESSPLATRWDVELTFAFMAAGTFNATNAAMQMQANGVLTARGRVVLPPVSSYEAWALTNGLAGEPPSADADCDGVCNGLLWALGLAADDEPWSHLPRPAGPRIFTLSPPSGGTREAIVIETSQDLRHWSPLEARFLSTANPIPAQTSTVVTISPANPVESMYIRARMVD